MDPGQCQEQLEGGPSLPRLEARQRADGDLGRCGKISESETPLQPHGPQSRSDGLQDVFDELHAHILPFWQWKLSSWGDRCRLVRMDKTYDVVVIGGGAAG